MNKNILFFCSLLFAGSLSVQAQIMIEPDVVNAAFLSADLTDNYLDLETHCTVTNTSPDTIEIMWTRELAAECSGEWDTQICDNNACYNFSVNSNINPGSTPNAPFILAPGESFDEFAFHVWPRATAGCCEVKVNFALVNNPDVSLAKVTFNFSINDNSCGFVNSTKEELEAANVSISPNPTSDHFTLTNNEVIKRLTVYNILGTQVKSYPYFNGENFDVTDLVDGFYFVGLQNETGQTLKTLRLSKKGIRP